MDFRSTSESSTWKNINIMVFETKTQNLHMKQGSTTAKRSKNKDITLRWGTGTPRLKALHWAYKKNKFGIVHS